MNEKVEDCVKGEEKTTDDEKPNYRNYVKSVIEVFERNWKFILPITAGLALLCATVYIITKKESTFSINIFIFPGFILMASCVRSVEVQKWFIYLYLRHQDFWQYQPSGSPSLSPPPPPPPPPPSPPPPPPNTITGHRRNRLECRKLSWELLSPDLLEMDTIWKKVKKHMPLRGIFDPEHIITEFAVTSSQESSQKKTKRETALHERKIFNISIVIVHYKLKAVDITQCLTSGNCGLDPEVLKQLLSFAPDDQELKAMKKQKKENEISLESAELFYLEVINSVPSYKERLRTVLFKSQLEERITQIKPHLQVIVTACEELMSSDKLTTFIEMLLTMGNIMNGSETCAFKITFITKLIDYKSTVNKKASVLDYLGRVINTKCPHIAALEEELKHVEQAARVPLKTLDKEIKELKADMVVLEDDVKRISPDDIGRNSTEDSFYLTVERFTVTAKEEVSELLSLRKDVKTNLRLLAQYFGEDVNKTEKTEEFFGMFATLLRQFRDVLQTNKSLQSTEELTKAKHA